MSRTTARAGGWRPRRPGRWEVLVPVVVLAAGALFAVSAQTARGTDLRSAGTSDLAGSVRAQTRTVDGLGAELARVQAGVDGLTTTSGRGDAGVAALQARVAALADPFGTTPVTGPGLTVTLDDAPPGTADTLATTRGDAVDPNQLVIHQSDLQSVVNALWAGGARAVAIGPQRLVPTSAVRCVGNTLLLNGRVYSPPFAVAAVGPVTGLRAALSASAGVDLVRQAARYYDIGYSVSGGGTVTVPAYAGPVALSYATPG